MGSYDGAEICELVGLFLLHLLSQKFKKENTGLYRDDGLAIFKGKSKRTNELIKKGIIKIFKDNDLNIEIKCNLKSVDYLDVTFDLNDGTYKPFNKPNNSPTYVHVESNHPPTVIKQIPLSISKRISNNSSSKQIFDNAAPYYNNVLEKSGYKEKLSYCPDTDRNMTASNTKRR